MTESHDDPILLVKAKTSFEAKVIVSVLQGEGIPAYSSGGNLMDEFAVTQRFLNLQGVDVFVPADRIDDAKTAIAVAREAGNFIEGDGDD